MSKKAGYQSAASHARGRAIDCEKRNDWWNAQIWWAKYAHWRELAKKEDEKQNDDD